MKDRKECVPRGAVIFNKCEGKFCGKLTQGAALFMLVFLTAPYNQESRNSSTSLRRIKGLLKHGV